jgi:hypothetical protein
LEESSGRRKLRDKLIYAMQVSERISLEDYWNDSRFQYKKPIMNGTLVTMFGDNFYHKDEEGNWIQEDSSHCKLDGTCNHDHLETDTSGNNVLISEYFFYFGDKAPTIPKELIEICHTGIGEKKFENEKVGDDFINWVTSNFHSGIHGDPLNWQEYNQLTLFS